MHKPRASAQIEQIGYPKHAEDSGPFLPTTGGGVICAKCHIVIREPDFTVLRSARAAHKAAGCDPVNVDRPTPAKVADLTPPERTALLRVSNKRGNGDSLQAKFVEPLVFFGLVEEERVPGGIITRKTTDKGAALANLCREAANAKKVETRPMFDLGPAQTKRSEIPPHLRSRQG